MARAQRYPKLEEIEMTYADQLREEGRVEGRTEGQRQLLVRQLETRFGPLGTSTRRKVEGLESPESIDRVATRLLLARSLEELGLG